MKVAVANEYDDPRLVSLYDDLNPLGKDTQFYIQLAKTLGAKDIVDLGCGTGLLAVELAKNHHLVGIEPSKAMLQIAQERKGAQSIEWIHGDARSLAEESTDLVIMAGHTAQVFLGDKEWASNLASIYKSLRPGGYLAFESRNPEAKAWESWNKSASLRQLIHSGLGNVSVWNELQHVVGECVQFKNHYVLHDTGEELIAECEIRFRTQIELESSLRSTGFEIAHMYTDWDGVVINGIGKELIFVARKPLQ